MEFVKFDKCESLKKTKREETEKYLEPHNRVSIVDCHWTPSLILFMNLCQKGGAFQLKEYFGVLQILQKTIMPIIYCIVRSVEESLV